MSTLPLSMPPPVGNRAAAVRERGLARVGKSPRSLTVAALLVRMSCNTPLPCTFGIAPCFTSALHAEP